MAYSDSVERVAVNDSGTVIADRVRYMSGETECSLFKIDEAWDYKKESLEEFCLRNINYGSSETFSEKEIDAEFEKAAKDHEYDRYALVDYYDVYTEEDGTYTVNNLSREKKIFAPKDASDEDLIEALKGDNYFRKNADNSSIVVSGDDLLVELEQDDGYPLCRLEKEETTICPKKEKERKAHRAL